MANQGLLAITLFEATAFLILLVLYALLHRDLPARFLRLWLLGWALFTAYGVARILYLLRGGALERLVMQECYFSALSVFLLSVLVYIGRSPRLTFLWPLGAIGGLWVALETLLPAGGELSLVRWSTAALGSGILIAAGWDLSAAS